MELGRDELTSLTTRFEELGLSELSLSVRGMRVELTRGRAAPVVTVTAPTTEPTTALRDVPAPSVGIVSWAAQPGGRVAERDVVCVLEVWTRTVVVAAGVSGTVRRVYVTEGQLAEYGQPLVGIEPS